MDSEPDPTPLSVSRLTLIKAIPFEAAEQAAEWLDRVGADEALSLGLARDVARTANRALQAHRVAAPAPYLPDIDPGEAVAVRFGYGSGEEVSEGRWSAATEMGERRRQGLRTELIDGVGAQERVAAVLGGRDRVRPEEELLIVAERAQGEGQLDLAVLTAQAALAAAGRRGVEVGEASLAIEALCAGLGAGRAELDPEAVRKGLRASRRAIRARPDARG